MKTISPGLKQGIMNGTVATCVKITRKDGIVKGFTNHDVVLKINSVDYIPTPALQRINMQLRNNAEVSNQEFAGAWVVDLDETDLKNGVYDDANIEVFRVDWTDVSLGSVNMFTGNLGLIQWTEDGFRADVHSTMKQLTRPVGIAVTAKCRHQLFSTAQNDKIGFCGIDKSSNTYTSSITNVILNKLSFDAATIGQPDGWVTNGVLTWTSGNNNGMSQEVKIFTNDSYELFIPTIYSMQVGDTFEVTTGCDKTVDTCKAKFNNVINFGGFPDIRSEVNYK